jgi:hypothetical protein
VREHRFALDSDVVVALVNSGRADEVALLPVVITDAVWDELTDEEKVSRQKIERQEALLKAIAGAPTRLDPETNEARAIAELEMPSAPAFGLGERSVIAYAMHNPDTIAVLIDKFALHRASEELAVGQVMSLHRALHALEGLGLPSLVAEATSRRWCKLPHRPPRWWSGRAAP